MLIQLAAEIQDTEPDLAGLLSRWWIWQRDT